MMQMPQYPRDSRSRMSDPMQPLYGQQFNGPVPRGYVAYGQTIPPEPAHNRLTFMQSAPVQPAYMSSQMNSSVLPPSQRLNEQTAMLLSEYSGPGFARSNPEPSMLLQPQQSNGQPTMVPPTYDEGVFIQPTYGLPAYGQPVPQPCLQPPYGQPVPQSQSQPQPPYGQTMPQPPYGQPVPTSSLQRLSFQDQSDRPQESLPVASDVQQVRSQQDYAQIESNPFISGACQTEHPTTAQSCDHEAACDQYENVLVASGSSEQVEADGEASSAHSSLETSSDLATSLVDGSHEGSIDDDPEYSIESLHEMEFELPSGFEEAALSMNASQPLESSVRHQQKEPVDTFDPCSHADSLSKGPHSDASYTRPAEDPCTKGPLSGSRSLWDHAEIESSVTEAQEDGLKNPCSESDEQYRTQEMEPDGSYQLPVLDDDPGNGDSMSQGNPIIQIQQPRKSHGWIVGLVAVLCIFALLLYGMISCSRVMGAASSESMLMSQNTIAVIEIDGTIQYDGSANSPEGLSQLLDYAEQTDAIKGVVLRVNSGGGVATAGEEMAGLVRDFSKPIVVSSASMNASAAYEISSQADYIFVSKTTEIGSIGTALELTDLSGLMELLGIDVEVITSSDSKDVTYGYRPLTDEEREYYQRLIDQINDVFIDNVAEGRGMTKNAVRQLANGLVYTGIDAVDNGLADEIGSREDALDYAAQLAGLEEYSTYDLGFSTNNLDLLSSLL